MLLNTYVIDQYRWYEGLSKELLKMNIEQIMSVYTFTANYLQGDLMLQFF